MRKRASGWNRRRRLLGALLSEAAGEKAREEPKVAEGRKPPAGHNPLEPRPANFEGFVFPGDVRFDGAIFLDGSSFDGATFWGDAWFKKAIFQGSASFKSANFNGGAVFDRASFWGDALFRSAEFTGHAWFDSVRFITVPRLFTPSRRNMALRSLAPSSARCRIFCRPSSRSPSCSTISGLEPGSSPADCSAPPSAACFSGSPATWIMP